MKELQTASILEAAAALGLTIFCIAAKQMAILPFSLVLSVLSFIQLFYLRKHGRVHSYLLKEARSRQDLPDSAQQIKDLKLALNNAYYSSLQSQINPHFLYNTLDSIRSKALVEGEAEIAEMAEKLAVFFRYCISNKEHLVRVREELDHINDYYAIQKFRFGDRFDMHVSVEDDSILDLYIPKMTLQPAVENALHHGIEKISRKGEVKIRAVRLNDDLEITVSDNGAGMGIVQLQALNSRMRSPQRTEGHKGNGIAVTNINERIRLTFGEQYGITYRSLENEGTDAVILLPAVDDFLRVRYEAEGITP